MLYRNGHLRGLHHLNGAWVLNYADVVGDSMPFL